jgi:hypothetical protein
MDSLITRRDALAFGFASTMLSTTSRRSPFMAATSCKKYRRMRSVAHWHVGSQRCSRADANASQ